MNLRKEIGLIFTVSLSMAVSQIPTILLANEITTNVAIEASQNLSNKYNYPLLQTIFKLFKRYFSIDNSFFPCFTSSTRTFITLSGSSNIGLCADSSNS